MQIEIGDGRSIVVDTPFLSAGPGDTEEWGRRLGATLPCGIVVGLSGGLGAGKTLLAGAIFHGAGLDREVHVTSPTFGIMNRYPAPLPLHHVDLYRLASAREAHAAGVVEILVDPGNGIVVVEWFEKFPEIHPPCWLRIGIEILDGGRRRIEAGGPNA